jgi:hypothetical protein
MQQGVDPSMQTRDLGRRPSFSARNWSRHRGHEHGTGKERNQSSCHVASPAPDGGAPPAAEGRDVSYPRWKIAQWRPDVSGRIEAIYTHWSAHDYASVFPAYHFCVVETPAGVIEVVNTHDVRENMRDVYEPPERPYAQHTRKRNSYALGISVMAMEGATPQDFGKYPLTDALVEGLCVVGARLASFYGVPIDDEHIMTHAEAALYDGYFGTDPDRRWDLARFAASPTPLAEQEARDRGEELRARMRAMS